MTLPFTDVVLATPFWLLLLLALPIWLLFQKRSMSSHLSFSGTHILKQLSSQTIDWLSILKYCLLWIGYILLVIAMSRPQIHHEEFQREAEGIDIVLAIDVSMSMKMQDFVYKGNPEHRIDAAKRNAAQFVEGRTDDRIGVIAYAGSPYQRSPITLDKDWVINCIKEISLYDLPSEDQGTAIGSAIGFACSRLEEQTDAKSRIIILLTDGANNSGKLEPVEAAEFAHTLGIKIYTIAVGTESGRLGRHQHRSPQQEFDIETLQKIASVTGGECYRAKSAGELKEIFTTIDKLEKTKIKSLGSIDINEHFFNWALAGFVLLSLGAILHILRLPPLP